MLRENICKTSTSGLYWRRELIRTFTLQKGIGMDSLAFEVSNKWLVIITQTDAYSARKLRFVARKWLVCRQLLLSSPRSLPFRVVSLRNDPIIKLQVAETVRLSITLQLELPDQAGNRPRVSFTKQFVFLCEAVPVIPVILRGLRALKEFKQALHGDI